MVATGFTHVSIVADDLEESAAFYTDLFGMERVPAPNFDIDVTWLRCGDLQLHLFDRDSTAPDFHHFGIVVDDFEAVYRRAADQGLADDARRSGSAPKVFELPDGAVQMYLRDPSGNLVEVNYPEASELDESVVTDITKRSDQVPQVGEAVDARLFSDALLERTA